MIRLKPCEDPNHQYPYTPKYAEIGKETETIVHICPSCEKTSIITRIKY